jgi:hypothetical protein
LDNFCRIIFFLISRKKLSALSNSKSKDGYFLTRWRKTYPSGILGRNRLKKMQNPAFFLATSFTTQRVKGLKPTFQSTISKEIAEISQGDGTHVE